MESRDTSTMSSREYLAYMAKKKKPKKAKYNNKWVDLDGIKFQSEKEADRYMVLKVLLQRGTIINLTRQVEYELNPGGQFSYKYRSDFEYDMPSTNQHIVEDTKGFITKEFKKKFKLMQRIHKITIRII